MPVVEGLVFVCVYVCVLCELMCGMCMQRPEEGVESLGTEPIGSVSPQILGTKQEMLLTTEPCSECLMS